jgi:hypothetical protein
MGLLDDFYAGLSDAADKAGTNISSGLSDPNVLQGLLAMGLSMMANNTGGASVGETLGRGGLAGLQQYGTAKVEEQKQADNALARQKVQQELESGSLDLATKKQAAAMQGGLLNLLGGAFSDPNATATTPTTATTTAGGVTTTPVPTPVSTSAALPANSVSAAIAPDVTSTGTPGVPPLPPMSTAPAGVQPVRPPIPPGGIGQPTASPQPQPQPQPVVPSIATAAGAAPGSATAAALAPKVVQPAAVGGALDAFTQPIRDRIAALPPAVRAAVLIDVAANGPKAIVPYLKVDPTITDSGIIIDKTTGKPIGSVPKVNADGSATMISFGEDGKPSMSMVPGAVDAMRDIARARLGVEGENKFTTIYINGRNVMVTEAQAKQLLNSGAATTTPPPAGGTGTGAAPVGGPPASTGSAQPAGTSGVGLPTGPSTSETSHTKAVDLATQRFFEKDQPAVQQAASSAQSIIDNAPILRANVSSTGFLAPAAAQVSAVLDGLGLHEYAKRADIGQTFNAVAGKPVADALIANKGTQTEGDAARARALFPQLGNTPDANRFLIDYMVAQARVQQTQNNFYNDSYADLARLNRLDLVHTIPLDWATKVRGSIWDQPEMKSWKARADAAIAAQSGGNNASR